MGDFLKGTFGTFLQFCFVILGFILIFAGFFGGGNWFLIILGILCWCASVGVRYWLGHIVRHR